MSLVLLGI